jgi:beta-galactosidase
VRQLRAGQRDICHLEFQVVDARGVRVPDAAQAVTFEVNGPAEILAVGNAELSGPESCHDNTHTTFQGRGLAILQSTATSGDVTVRATAPGLEPAVVVLTSR